MSIMKYVLLVLLALELVKLPIGIIMINVSLDYKHMPPLRKR